jgi:hypothetical protein
MEAMSTLTVSPEYGALLKKVAPKVIRTEKENEAYTEVPYELDRPGKSLARGAGRAVAQGFRIVQDLR